MNKKNKLQKATGKTLWENRADPIEEDLPVNTESGSVTLDLKNVAKSRCVCMLPDAKEIDFYRVLREQIHQHTRGRKWKTLMITSVNPGEGKTLTAINLAVTFAKTFEGNVLLIDGDLKQQHIHQCMGFPGKTGLIDHFLDDRPLEEIIVQPDIERLTVISGGRTIHNSSEILGSQRMRMILEEMKKRYDDHYILFDIPPVLEGADAIAFAPLADCILMVVQAGRTSVHDVRKALELIPKDKFLGFVLNRL